MMETESSLAFSFVDIRPPMTNNNNNNNTSLNGKTSDGSGDDGRFFDDSPPPNVDLAFLRRAVAKKKEYMQIIGRDVFVKDLRGAFQVKKGKKNNTNNNNNSNTTDWKSLWDQFVIDLPRQNFSVDGCTFKDCPSTALDAMDAGVRRVKARAADARRQSKKKKSDDDDLASNDRTTASPTPPSSRVSTFTSYLSSWIPSAPSSMLGPSKQPQRPTTGDDDDSDDDDEVLVAAADGSDECRALVGTLCETRELLLFCQQAVLGLAFQLLRQEYSNVFQDVHLVCSNDPSQCMSIAVRFDENTLTVEKLFHVVCIDALGETESIGAIHFTLVADAVPGGGSSCASASSFALTSGGTVLAQWRFEPEN
eukprot:PhM_4_TR19044/c0_g1_i1/m.58081